MTHPFASPRKFIVGAAVLALALSIVTTPAGRNVVVAPLIHFAKIAGRAARVPCWLVDRSSCFPLDRLDPTCPQCV
jgi:hypothetical protein